MIADPAAVTAFIRARLDELEKAAKYATDGPWYQVGMQVYGHSRAYAGGRPDVLVIRHTWPQEAAHIIGNDPPHVRLQVAAVRGLLDEYEASVRAVGPGLSGELGRAVAGFAAIWATHPDYPGTAL